MIKICLPEIDCSKQVSRYIGTRSRYATATAVSFINDNLILVASLLGKKIYLVSLDDENYKIIDSISTNKFPDLMDYKDNLVVTANTNSSTISLYNVVDGKLSFIKDLILNSKILPHGCRFVGNDDIIITNKYRKNLGCFQFNFKTKKCKKIISDTYVTKDIFIQKELSILVSTEFVATSKPCKSTKSIISLYDKNNNFLSNLSIKGQTESVTAIDNNVFITDQYNDNIIHCKIQNNKINFINNIKGLDFPHGICSFNNKIAVSNYGNNSVYIYNINEIV
jgi:hypothetical protein